MLYQVRSNVIDEYKPEKLSYTISAITNIVQISNFTIEVAFDISLYDYMAMAISNHNAIKLL
jgi:hypothetical protein